MAETTGTGVNDYAGGNQDNSFGDSRFWMQWIEIEASAAINNLAGVGFDTANGDFIPNSGSADSAVIPHAGESDTLDVLAIANRIGETKSGSGDATLFAVRFVSTLTITQAGGYTFSLNSDDGTIIYVDGVAVINDDGPHSASTKKTQVTTLAAGAHDIIIIIITNYGGAVVNRRLTWSDHPTETNFNDIPLSALQANAGDDVAAGDGADIIDGGVGDDTLTGGAGTDRPDTSGLNAAFGGTAAATDVTVTTDTAGAQTLHFPGGESLTAPTRAVDTGSPRRQVTSLVAMEAPRCLTLGTRVLTQGGGGAGGGASIHRRHGSDARSRPPADALDRAADPTGRRGRSAQHAGADQGGRVGRRAAAARLGGVAPSPHGGVGRGGAHHVRRRGHGAGAGRGPGRPARRAP
ncbi:MAG: Ca2+-binding RTX toxin-like protein [Paracoccaceae bacterium]|jgi:Ca2+-binding RTX toxin-like protein